MECWGCWMAFNHLRGRFLALRMSFRFARRLSRATEVRVAALLCTAASLSAVAAASALISLSLTPDQARQRDFGSFSASAGVGERTGPEVARSLRKVSQFLLAAEHPFSTLLLSQIQPSNSSLRPVAYLESDWQGGSWNSKYQIERGSFPSRPGQVAVSSALASYYPIGTSMQAISGHADLEVVGVVLPIFQQGDQIILAAGGTWETFDWTGIRRQGVAVSGDQRIYWSDANPLSTAAAMASAGLELTSLDLAKGSVRGWTQRLPIAYLVPSIFIAVMSTVGSFALCRRHQRRRVDVLRAVGVPALISKASSNLALASVCLSGSTLGCFLGALVGFLLRPALTSHSDQPLSPASFPLVPIIQWLGLVIVASISAPVALESAGERRRQRRLSPNSSRMIMARRFVLVATIAFGIQLLATASSVLQVMALVAPLTVAALLTIPEVVAVGRRIAVTTAWPPRVRLVARHLESDPTRPALVVALVLVAMGPGLLLPVLAQSISYSENARQISTAAPGQLLVLGPNGDTSKPPDRRVVRALQAAAPKGSSAPVDLYEVTNGTVSASFSESGATIIAVDSLAEAEALSNGTLTSLERSTLGSGGAISWLPGSADPKLYVADGSRMARTISGVPLSTGPFPASWRQLYSGLILRPSLRAIGLPSRKTAIVFTGLASDDGTAMKSAVFKRGLDVSSIYFSRKPIPYVLPLGLKMGAAGVLGLLLLSTIALVGVQVRGLRSYGSRLLEIGLPQSWIFRTVLMEVGLLLSAGVLYSALSVILPIAVVAGNVPDLVIAVPWIPLLGTGAAWVAIAFSVTWVSCRRTTTGAAASR